jgi:hypothetical protein
VTARYKAKVETRSAKLTMEMHANVNEQCDTVTDTIARTSKDVLGYSIRKQHPEWLSKDTIQLMEERRQYKYKRAQHSETAKQHNCLCHAVKKSATNR